MSDLFLPSLWREKNIFIAAATTTELCQTAQQTHDLADTTTIALGRLLTATALCGLSTPQPGLTSVQIIATRQLSQLFADLTEDGALRGYVKNPQFSLPSSTYEKPLTRRIIGAALGRGTLSVIRTGSGGEFNQSTVEIVSGEIDEDMANFLRQSDQRPTTLVCDVLLNDSGVIQCAGGVIIQGLPQADESAFMELSNKVGGGLFSALLQRHATNPRLLLQELAPRAEEISGNLPLVWKCRCSYERVLNALRILDAVNLADMVAKKEAAEVYCDFCGQHYRIEWTAVEQIYLGRVQKND